MLSASRTVALFSSTRALVRPNNTIPAFNLVNQRAFAVAARKEGKDKGGGDHHISPWYAVAGGLAFASLAGYKYLHDLFGGTEGLQRSASFYVVAIPRYIEYRMHMWKGSDDKVWDELHEKTSQDALRKMLELKGFYIKSGQMCAANIGNAFPQIWQDTMSVLQDQVPPKDFETIRDVVESEYGKPISDVFATFDEIPIGAASIGQVHRATLKDGTEVVVKVMYPEVEGLFRGDVRTIKLFAQLAQPVHVPGINEIEKQFMNEFDYKREARQLAKVRENLIKAGLIGSGKNLWCSVPEPYLDLCTKRVLVMEEIKGDKLSVGLKEDMKNNAERAGMTPEEFLAEQKAKEEKLRKEGHEMHGPTASQYDTYIKLLNSQRRLENGFRRLHNLSFGWLPGVKRKEYVPKTSLPINHAKIVDELMYIHGHEVLVDGYFNADPHPGNLLLAGVEENKPHLGLIDYGQVKSISKEKRLLFCKLIIALADDNRDDIVRLMKEAGYKSQNMDEHNIYLYAKVGYDEDNKELTDGKHIQLFMEDLQNRDPIDELPKDFLMVSRCSIMLRGLAHALHQSRSVAKAWKPIAEKVLKEEGEL